MLAQHFRIDGGAAGFETGDGFGHFRGDFAEAFDAFLEDRIDHAEGALVAGGLKRIGGHERASHFAVPRAQGFEIADVVEVVADDAIDAAVDVWIIGGVAYFRGLRDHDLVRRFDIAARDVTGGNNCAVGDAHRAGEAALSAEKNRRLIEQHAVHDIADERSSSFVLTRGEVEMNVGGADFAVVFAAGAAGHEAVAKIDETAEGDVGEEDGLFEAYGVGAAGLLFDEAARPHMRAAAHGGAVEQHG